MVPHEFNKLRAGYKIGFWTPEGTAGKEDDWREEWIIEITEPDEDSREGQKFMDRIKITGAVPFGCMCDALTNIVVLEPYSHGKQFAIVGTPIADFDLQVSKVNMESIQQEMARKADTVKGEPGY